MNLIRNFSTTELTYFETEFRKFKSPWFSKLMFNAWFKFLKYITISLFLFIAIGMIWYNTFSSWNPNVDNVWNIIKCLVIFLFGISAMMLIAYLLEKIKIRIEAKRLGLTIYEWDFLIVTFKIER